MKSIKKQMEGVKGELKKENSIFIELPRKFVFKDHGIYDFNDVFSIFDWSLKNKIVNIDLTTCSHTNYQTLSLLVLYAWKLKGQGCKVDFNLSSEIQGASEIWRNMGCKGIFPVLGNERSQFMAHKFKPLFALRNKIDFKKVLDLASDYTKDFDIEFMHTLRYILSELLYNTLEHGQNYGGVSISRARIPSIVQFTWYEKSNELRFIIADNGIGIKKHIEQAYPAQESHEDAIRTAIKPQVSGTFGSNDPYTSQNNAGVGLFLSSNIIRKLNSEMHIISGDGLLHITPSDITSSTLDHNWPGTMVLVTIKDCHSNIGFEFEKINQIFKERAMQELSLSSQLEEESNFYLNISNYFGPFAEDKESAINYRNKNLFNAIDEGKTITIDFEGVSTSPHSFLSALLASPIKTLGMQAYKKIKFVNVPKGIRETIDFIMDDNT